MEEFFLSQQDRNLEQSGSALLIVFCDKDGILVVNVGDVACYGINESHRLTSSPLQRRSLKLVQLNTEHSLNIEQEREVVRKRGGFILKRGGCYRVCGELNLSRSIGDKKYKPYISSTPSVSFYSHCDFSFSEFILVTDGCV